MSASVVTGVDALRANLLRTCLSTIGVVMGAASLAAVLSLGDGAEAFARARLSYEGLQRIVLESVTADTVDGHRIPRTDYPIFTVADAEAIAAAVPEADVQLDVSGTALTAGNTPRAVLLQGVHAVRRAQEPEVVAGRWLTTEEQRRGARVAVVTEQTADALVGQAARDEQVGRTFSVGSVTFAVVGIVADPPGSRGLSAVAPVDAAMAAYVAVPQRRAPGITVSLPTLEQAPEARRPLAALVEGRPEWRGRVRIVAHGLERLAQARQGVLVMKMLLGAFTSISLLVGGIGIMNVLLASVAERTREIGIRKAVGARRQDILAQFLTESVAISAAGSVLGVLLGLGGAQVATAVIRAKTEAPIYASVSASTLIVSALAALAVGLAFGMYPALRAARLSPIDAIVRD